MKFERFDTDLNIRLAPNTRKLLLSIPILPIKQNFFTFSLCYYLYGGGDPSSISLLWYKSITQLIHFCKALGVYFNNLQICKSLSIYCNIKLLSKRCAKAKRAQKLINNTFLKSPCKDEFKYVKIWAKFLKTKFVFKENWKYANSFKALVQKSMQNCFENLLPLKKVQKLKVNKSNGPSHH